MPSPTVAQLASRLTNVAALAYKGLNDLVTDLPTPLDTILADTPTVNSDAQNAAAARYLQFAAGLSGEPAADLMQWSFYDFAYAASQLPASDLGEAISLTVDYFIANNLQVKSRGITFGSASAGGSNVGNGVVKRQTVDEHGYKIEAVTFETKSLQCVSDARTGIPGTSPAVNREVFTLKGEPINKYGLSVTGSGLLASLVVADITAINFLSDSLFAGASFSTAPSTGSPQAPTALGNWSVTTIGRITCDVDTLPRDLPVAGTTAYKVVFGNSGATADNGISLSSAYWLQVLPTNAPVHAEVWLRRRSSCTGTGTLTLGSQTATVSISSLTNDTWTRLQISDGTDNKGWPSVWNQNSTTFGFALSSSGATGTLEVAFPMLVPMQQLDGTWWAMLPGTTPFVAGDASSADVFTVTDALTGSDSKVQQLIARLFNRYLPHNPNATQVAASGGRTLTFANSGSADTITASSGSFVSDGYVAGMRVTIAGTSSNNMTTGPIATVAATVLTFESQTSLTNEGPLSATATLDGAAYITEPS